MPLTGAQLLGDGGLFGAGGANFTDALKNIAPSSSATGGTATGGTVTAPVGFTFSNASPFAVGSGANASGSANADGTGGASNFLLWAGLGLSAVTLFLALRQR